MRVHRILGCVSLAVMMLASSEAVWAAAPGPVDKDAPEAFTATKSGLKYRIRRKSNGDKPKAANGVVAHYKGWLDNGKEFDSSYKRGEPSPFPLNRVIPGWTEGVQLMVEGEKTRFWIPENLAYKGKSAPYGLLVFNVELIKFE